MVHSAEHQLLDVSVAVLIGFQRARFLLLPRCRGRVGGRGRGFVPLHNRAGLLSVRTEPVQVAFFYGSTHHVYGVLKIIRIRRKEFVAVFEHFVVVLLGEVIVHEETIGENGIVAFFADSVGKLLNQCQLLRGIRRGVYFVERMIHVRSGVDRNIFSNLLRCGDVPSAQQNSGQRQPFNVSHMMPPVIPRGRGHPQP